MTEEIRRLREAGAVGDVLGNDVDAEGHLLESPETSRLVGLSLQELQAIDTVVVVASEREKPVAILGVLRTGTVDVLVLDEGNARRVLQMDSTSTVRPETEV
jgi:DNA-binding transcriptional regulator LsrR (DeoR family)